MNLVKMVILGPTRHRTNSITYITNKIQQQQNKHANAIWLHYDFSLSILACWYYFGLSWQEYEQLFAAFWWSVRQIKYKVYGYVTPRPCPRNAIFSLSMKTQSLICAVNKAKLTFKVFFTKVDSCMYIFMCIFIIEWRWNPFLAL